MRRSHVRCPARRGFGIDGARELAVRPTVLTVRFGVTAVSLGLSFVVYSRRVKYLSLQELCGEWVGETAPEKNECCSPLV